MAIKRNPNPVVSRDLTEAIGQIVEDAIDAGVDFKDIEEDNSPKIKGRFQKDENSLNDLVALKSQGGPIPGQSLTNSPDQPYPWERPAEFANPREALDNILSTLLQPEAIKEIINSLANGASVGDLAMAIVYAKFVEGKINPDIMLLTMEPIMYILMAIGEEANIEYNIDNDDIDEEDEEEIKEKLDEFENVFQQIKNGVMNKDIKVEKIQEGAVDKGLLDRVKEAGPQIRESLLARGEE